MTAHECTLTSESQNETEQSLRALSLSSFSQRRLARETKCLRLGRRHRHALAVIEGHVDPKGLPADPACPAPTSAVAARATVDDYLCNWRLYRRNTLQQPNIALPIQKRDGVLKLRG